MLNLAHAFRVYSVFNKCIMIVNEVCSSAFAEGFGTDWMLFDL